MKKLYAEREVDELDTYMDHVSAMTSEQLHSKSAIAAELAFRDERINKLEKVLRYYKYDCTGNEPSISVFHRELDELGI